MAYLWDFAQHVCAKVLREDPAEREAKIAVHVREMRANADAAKTQWAAPSKVHGFWRAPNYSATYEFSKVQNHKYPGRQDYW
eukprot:CAMPEP_0197848602 /NCGR_PEP_ID=MMETSP1438-20131217/9301_1 /TAXON_ID=1461541 /ORGANISM="Pterosperma sp., Strain CCMP1384" /LENGTH=81 /DNA_ID=CAMNT_0043460935 /DNA_START=59 /DNA_END=301 /DNA_ORIENTATION=+